MGVLQQPQNLKSHEQSKLGPRFRFTRQFTTKKDVFITKIYHMSLCSHIFLSNVKVLKPSLLSRHRGHELCRSEAFGVE